jgi:hypothetical protein
VNRPEHIQFFEKALSSENPAQELSRLAITLRDEGVSQVELYGLFEHFQIATSGDDPRYDAIVDTMELICGGPWAKGHGLFPTELTEAQINEHRKKT